MSDFFELQDQEENKRAISATKKKVVVGSRVANGLKQINAAIQPKITLLLDVEASPRTLEMLFAGAREAGISWMNRQQVDVFYCWTHSLPEEDGIIKNVGDWVWDRAIDVTLLPKGRNIVAMGRAFYTFTKDSDIQVDGFYDTVFNRPYIECQELRCLVFPAPFLIGGVLRNDRNMPRDGLKNIRYHQNFESWFFKEQLNRATTESFLFRNEPPLQLKPLLVKEEIDQFLIDNVGPGEIAWDLETSGFDYQRDEIKCFTCSFDGITGYYLPWELVDPVLMNDFLEGKTQILANGKFDVRFLRHRGINHARVDIDTFILGHILNEMRNNSLKTHAWIYTKHGGYDNPLELWKRRNKNHPGAKNYAKIPYEILFPYATMDPIVTYQVAKGMERDLIYDHEVCNHDFGPDHPSLLEYWNEHIRLTFDMFVDIEMDGLLVDWSKMSDAATLVADKIVTARSKVIDCLPGSQSINIDSGKDLGLFLEHTLKWPELDDGRTKGDYYATAKENLEEWSKLGLRGAKELVDYSEWVALRNTFVGDPEEDTLSEEALEALSGNETAEWEKDDFWEAEALKVRGEPEPKGWRKFRAWDGCIHASIMPFGAASHRHRTNNPNLQNVPKRIKEQALIIRSCYPSPGPDFYIGEIDYAGFQLRIGAAQSGDKQMIDAFQNIPGGDLHSVTAQAVFAPSITLDEFLKLKKKDPYKTYRAKSKGTNFGFLFGSSARNFRDQILLVEWTDDEANSYVVDHHLEVRVAELWNNGHDRSGKRPNRETYKQCVFLACAEKVRETFFTLYPELEAWHGDCHAEAEALQYVRSPFGARRLIPQLNPDAEGKDTDGKEKKNCQNISINTKVQNHEVIPMTHAMLTIHTFIKKHKLKSRLVLTVHDSIMLYIHNTELVQIVGLALQATSRPWPQNKGVPTCGEMNLAKWGEPWGLGSTEIDDANFPRMLEILGETATQVVL